MELFITSINVVMLNPISCYNVKVVCNAVNQYFLHEKLFSRETFTLSLCSFPLTKTDKESKYRIANTLVGIKLIHEQNIK